MKPLAGKVAIVAGAAGGIGLGAAQALAHRGVKVVLADIDGARAQASAAAITQTGGQALGVASDVTREDAFDQLRAAAVGEFGQVDIVMNNAGSITRGAPEDLPFSEWERIINLNFMSVVRSISLFIPDMIARGSGHIVNTASAAGLFPYAYDRLPYAASKAALVTYSEGLALYLKPKGVGVTCLCPGPVRTDFSANVKNFTPGLNPKGPSGQYDKLEPLDVGEMVADAIEADRFFLPTHDELRRQMQQRATDPDAFIDRRIADLATP